MARMASLVEILVNSGQAMINIKIDVYSGGYNVDSMNIPVCLISCQEAIIMAVKDMRHESSGWRFNFIDEFRVMEMSDILKEEVDSNLIEADYLRTLLPVFHSDRISITGNLLSDKPIPDNVIVGLKEYGIKLCS